MTVWLKRGVWIFGTLLLILLLLYSFRTSILRGMGNYLIAEDPPTKAELVFVLGGNSYDRGRKAAALYKEKKAERIVCLGANVPSVLQALGIDSSEGHISASIADQRGVPEEAIRVLEKGTSTMGEAIASLRYCRKNGIDSAIVLSDKFHLRRVRYVFEPLFKDSDTELHYRGTPSSLYDESHWWRSEAGMIMVNNEYMKLLYYRFFKKPPSELKKKE